MKVIAHAERDEAGYWVAEVDEVPGAITQAKRIDLLRSRISEVVELFTGKTIDPWKDIDLRIEVPGEAGQVAEQARQLRSEIERLESALSDSTARAVKALRAQGLPLRDIGQLVGVSYQRVHQLLEQ